MLADNALWDFEPGDTRAAAYAVAVDVGTTTVVAHLVDLNTSETVARQATYNSQIQYGEDVISRIVYASKNSGGQELRDRVLDTIRSTYREANELLAARFKSERVRELAEAERELSDPDALASLLDPLS